MVRTLILQKSGDVKLEKVNWKKTFFTIWSGQAVSLLGSAAAQFTIIWWLTIKTGSPSVLAMATLVGFLPQAVIGPFAGVWVDRLSRKTVLISADIFIAAASGVLVFAFYLGTPPIWLAYAVLFWRALGSVFHVPAMQASMPLLVPEEELTKTAGWSQFLQSASYMAGPVLGAMLMAAFSIPVVMAMDVITAFAAVGTVAVVPIPNPAIEGTEKRHMLREIFEALQVINQNKALKILLIPMTIVTIVYLPVGSLFPLMVNTHFSGTAWHASLVESVFAGGLLVSSLMLGIWGGFKNKFVMVSLSLDVLGLAIAVSGLLPGTAFVIFVILSGIMGLTGNFYSVPIIAFIQGAVPPESLGRVYSLLTSIMSLATPIGLLIAGPIAEIVGVAPWFFISGVLILANGVLCHILTRGIDQGIDRGIELG